MLEDEALMDEEDATEDQGDQGSGGQRHTHVGHPVVEGGDGHTVREHALQAHEEKSRGERHARPHVVERLGMVHLKVPHHNQSHSVGAPRHQGAGVDPAAVAVLYHLGVAQKAHHHHHEGSDVPDQAKEAALWWEGATFTDEGDILNGAARLGEAWSEYLLGACHIVRPVFHRTNMMVHHSHGVDYPYSSDGEGREADRQDDPGSHWAGSVLALSKA